MRTHRLAWLVLIWAAASPLAATEAIQSLVGLTDFGVIAGGGAGFAFKPATNLSVSALGYLFATNYTALDSAVVELLDSRGTLLASATLTTNVPPQGDWRYHSISSVFVPANSTNYIVAYDPVEYAASHTKAWAGAFVQADSPGSTWFEAAPELLYLGPADGTNIIGAPSYYFIGANFQFTPTQAPPALRILLTQTNRVILSWSTQAVGFSLQTTANLFSWPATNLPTPPVVIGTNNVLVLPVADPRTFFHLVQSPN